MNIIPLHAHSGSNGRVITSVGTDYIELTTMLHPSNPGLTVRMTSDEAFRLVVQLIQDARESDRRKNEAKNRNAGFTICNHEGEWNPPSTVGGMETRCCTKCNRYESRNPEGVVVEHPILFDTPNSKTTGGTGG